MGMLAAFLFGYWMGTRSGEEGIRKLRDATVAVVGSEEFQTTVAGATAMARSVLTQGLENAFGAADQFSRPRAA